MKLNKGLMLAKTSARRAKAKPARTPLTKCGNLAGRDNARPIFVQSHPAMLNFSSKSKLHSSSFAPSTVVCYISAPSVLHVVRSTAQPAEFSETVTMALSVQRSFDSRLGHAPSRLSRIVRKGEKCH